MRYLFIVVNFKLGFLHFCLFFKIGQALKLAILLFEAFILYKYSYYYFYCYLILLLLLLLSLFFVCHVVNLLIIAVLFNCIVVMF